MSEIILLPAMYEGSFDRKDKTKKLTFGTQEITFNQAGQLNDMLQSFVYLAIKKEEFSKAEIEVIENLKTDFDDSKKPASQRMRAVLFRLWQQDNEGFKSETQHYEYHMEKFINHLKSKLQ